LGAPTQRGKTKPYHFIRSAQLLREAGIDFDGLIAAENGGHNSFGGWIPAAALGLPIVDTPGDGRAHPTAIMGSMGLHRQEYRSIKTGVSEGVELIVRGSLHTTSNVIRALARDMEALIAMSRDPVSVNYAKEHGAPGAISLAIEIGKSQIEARGKSPYNRISKVADDLGGALILKGRVHSKITEARGGFDVGKFKIKSEDAVYEVTYVNEYMTLERESGSESERLATFPDLIATFNEEGEPITSSSINEEETLYILKVPKEKIPIGDGNKYPEVYKEIEMATGKKIIHYLDDFFIAN